MQLLLTSAAPSNIGQGGDTNIGQSGDTIVQTQFCVTLRVGQATLLSITNKTDDDETFRNVLQLNASLQTKETLTTCFRKTQADPGCISVKTTVYKRGNLFTRSCGLDSIPVSCVT